MAIFEQNTNIHNLAKITSGGLSIASFPQIRETLINEFRNIYGNDIDVSPASADGQYINAIALIFNNTLVALKNAYDNLDPASATGKYLDILCSYNNILRRSSTKSRASLYVKHLVNTTVTPDFLEFVDKSGITWIWHNDKNITWNGDEALVIDDVICDKFGAITAYGTGAATPDFTSNNKGDICISVDYSDWASYQIENAEVGRPDETDEALRSRRYQSFSSQAQSILSALETALLNLTGIDDVFIYSNNTGSSQTIDEPADDGVSVDGHSIYIAMKYDAVDDDIIGNIIYNKLTPGICTTQNPNPDSTTGDVKSYTILKTNSIKTILYWKKCKPITLSNNIVIHCIINSLFTQDLTDPVFISRFKDSIFNYLETIRIDEKLNQAQLLMATQKADELKNGLPTFYATSIDNGNISMNLQYFDRATLNLTIAAETTTETNGFKITISSIV